VYVTGYDLEKSFDFEMIVIEITRHVRFPIHTDCLHGLLPGQFLLGYLVLVFSISLFFRFCAVRKIKLAMSSAFERMQLYRIVSYNTHRIFRGM